MFTFAIFSVLHSKASAHGGGSRDFKSCHHRRPSVLKRGGGGYSQLSIKLNFSICTVFFWGELETSHVNFTRNKVNKKIDKIPSIFATLPDNTFFFVCFRMSVPNLVYIATMLVEFNNRAPWNKNFFFSCTFQMMRSALFSGGSLIPCRLCVEGRIRDNGIQM